MSDTPSAGIPRRHDLDALRAFAMLLGIALHAALSFVRFPWTVQDLQQKDLFGLFFFAIHGFRMPLFILVSGYFTMMLWRRRGLKPLLKQRFQRVLVPCLLGVATVVPAMHWVSAKAAESARKQDAARRADSGTEPQLIAAIRKGDVTEVELQLTGGADPNQSDPEFGVPPLAWAAMYGDEVTAKLLIEKGADVNGKDRDGYRALHSAAFLGHLKVVELLIERGADPKARGPLNGTARDSAQADWGTTKAITGSLRVPLRSEEEVVAGRTECRAFLASHGDDGETDVNPASQEGGLEAIRKAYVGFLTSDRFLIRWRAEGEPFHLILSPVFDHLWFLWFLCWLVGGFALFALLAERLPMPGLPRWLVVSPLRLLWLLPLTMVPQLLMGIFAPAFGPDTSVGILPQPHLLIYYGIYFGFGALYYDADDHEGRLGRWWWLTIPVALFVALPLGLATLGQPVLSGVAQVIYGWAMTFGLIGLFQKFLTGENRAIRYLSDSAYWLYVAHLPLVLAAQAWVRTWDLPAFVKFSFICTLVTGFLLVTYQALVRYTWLGRLLNGPRSRIPSAKKPAPVPEPQTA
ncbi:MAG: acyltransferase family protein [Planctomycetales bacterium]